MHIRTVRGKEVATKMLINSLRRFIAKGKNIDKYNDKEIKEIEEEDEQLSRKISVIERLIRCIMKFH